MARIRAIAQGQSLDFSFSLPEDETGNDVRTTGFTCLMEVKQFPEQDAFISRIIPESADALSWEGFLTSAETAPLPGSSESPYYTLAKITNIATGEQFEISDGSHRFHVTETFFTQEIIEMGDFNGPPSSVPDNIVTFADATGKAGKDSGVPIADVDANTTHRGQTDNPHAVTKTQVGLANVTDDAQLKRSDGDINSFPEKISIADNDLFLVEDSASSFTKKKVKAINLPGGASIPAFESRLLHIQDQKPNGTDGGTFTSGTEQTRDLNTVLTNEIAGASLAANQITLPAGTYFIEASAPANTVEHHKTRLRDITGGATLLPGTTEKTDAAGGGLITTRSFVKGRFTLGVESDVELQHRCQDTRAGDGFGSTVAFGPEVELYSDVLIWRIA